MHRHTDPGHARNCRSTLRAQPNDFAENEEHTRLYRSVDAKSGSAPSRGPNGYIMLVSRGVDADQHIFVACFLVIPVFIGHSLRTTVDYRFLIHFAEVLFEDDSRVARHVIYYYGSIGPLLEDENSKLAARM